MAALASDWLTHFELLLKNGWRDLLQTCYKCSLWGPNQELLLFKPIWNPIWPPWPLIGWHILNFFSRMAEEIYSKLATNVPYEVLAKCCYILSRSEIQYGRPGLWLADTFWTSSQERLNGSTPNFHKCSLWGPDQVLLHFKLIRNPIWPSWPLVGWHILNFFSRTTEGIYTTLATHVPYEVPTKCCYFLSRSEIQYGRPGLWLAYILHILNFFSRMAERIYSKLATNVPYEAPTKCCYFLSRSEIQYGHLGLWLADKFWTSFQEGLKGSYSKVATNVPYEILTMCCYYLNGSKSSVAVIALIGWHTRSW